MQICASCGEENPDRFRLCGYCGAHLAADLPAQQARKTVTVIFCDLKGSTSLGERLDTETLREVLSHYFGQMKKVLESHGGTIEKYIGDAIVAVYGLPRAHEDDAFRAVRAAADMQAALAQVNEELKERWGVTLANRTGINTGEVVAGELSQGQRLVTGDTMNVAARLEQAAAPMEALIGESTYRLVREAVEVEPLEPLSLKGKAEPVRAYRLISVTDAGAFPRRVDTPLVGRQRELGLIHDRFEQVVRDRVCGIVTVLGDAGVGKSRLVHELVTRVATQASSLRARCLPYGEGITFWPLAEIVRQAAGIESRDGSDEARAKIAAMAGGSAHAVTERIASALGLSAETFPVKEMFWAARKLLETLARERPLIVVIEDIHWAERTLLDLLEHLAESVQDSPVLMICTARRDLLDDHPAWGEARANMDHFSLDPLTAQESEEIVQNLLGDLAVPPELSRRIVVSAQGNPLFVEQMLSMLIDDGLVERDGDGRWVLHGDAASLSVPPSISALLAARLDHLGPPERAVIERGSVIGALFYQGAVEALSPEALRDGVPASLHALCRRQLIQPDPSDLPDEQAFRFHHILIRDAAYQGLLKRDRIRMHETFAGWLEERAGNLTEFEEIRGYHLEQAYLYRAGLGRLDEEGAAVGHRAAQLLSAAGRRAFARGDMPAAAHLLGRAAALLARDDPIRLSLLPDLGEALMDVGEFSRAEEFLDEAISEAVAAGDRRLEMDARVVRMLVHSSVAESWSEELLRECELAIPVLEQERDQAALARAWRLVGWVHATAGRYGAAEEAILTSIEHARDAGDRRQEIRAFPIFAACALYGPAPVPEAIRRCEELLQQASGDQRGNALIRLYLSQLYAMVRQFGQARNLYHQSRATLEDLGERLLAAFTASNSGRVELLAEDAVMAEQELRRDYAALDGMGEKFYLSTIAALLAHALYLQGRYEEAESFSKVSEETSEDDVESQSLWRRARAKVLARYGRFQEAEALARNVTDDIAQTDSPVLRGNTLLDLAEVLRLSGRSEEAAPLEREALQLFDRKGNLAGAARARSRLSAEDGEPAEIGTV